MTRHQNFIKKALDLAQSSPHRKFKHGAIVTHNNRALAKAVNYLWNNPEYDPEHASVHAEIAAIKKLRVGKHITVYVARVNRAGDPMLSRPCSACWDYLADIGVHEVVYSLTGGGYAVERIR